MSFKKAVKYTRKSRIALHGSSGSGKSYSALLIATTFGKTAVIDTEHGSASLYSNLFDFDVIDLEKDFHPKHYIKYIKEAESQGYKALVIDSLSHAWSGTNGILQIVNGYGGSFKDWGKVAPLETELIEAILSSKLHIIATMRSKTEYAMDQVENKQGRIVTQPRKVGLAPEQRKDIEYEFDIVGQLDSDNILRVSKTRCSDLIDYAKVPDKELAQLILHWLDQGEDPKILQLRSKLENIFTLYKDVAGSDHPEYHQLETLKDVDLMTALGKQVRADYTAAKDSVYPV